MKKCCRSSPRCRRCPVLVKAEARARPCTTGPGTIVEEILGGGSPALPSSVADALDALSFARGRYLARHP
jgi:hypothetical protein